MRKTAIILILLSISAYFYASTALSHIHIIDGQIIFHFHLGADSKSEKDCKHQHSKNELLAIDGINKILDETLLTDIFTLKADDCSAKYQKPLPKNSAQSSVICSVKQLRAPPFIA